MDQELLQRTRYVLRSRVRKVQTCPKALFVSTCRHFVRWIENHPVLSGSVHYLQNVPGVNIERITKTLSEAPIKALTGEDYDPGSYNANYFEEHASICLSLVEAVARIENITKDKDKDLSNRVIEFLILNFGEYLTGDRRIEYDDAIEAIRDVAVDGLYEYLDEQIDTRNVLYAVLLKYKQRSEWFRRERLRGITKNGLEGKTGERALALDLQEYILDQGVEFFVEPLSVSGEADLVLRDSEGRYIITDAKYISADATRSTILNKLASGFNQVSRYCNDFNEPSGFLVPFVLTATKIRLDLEESDGLRYLSIGGKIIYYLPINIANLPSASTEGQAEEILITADELVKEYQKKKKNNYHYSPEKTIVSIVRLISTIGPDPLQSYNCSQKCGSTSSTRCFPRSVPVGNRNI